MTRPCPHCAGTGHITDPVTTTADRLRDWCARNGHWCSPDDRVNEQTAAELLGFDVGTLQKWRYGSGPLPFVRAGNGRGRITYRLADLAAHLLRDSD